MPSLLCIEPQFWLPVPGKCSGHVSLGLWGPCVDRGAGGGGSEAPGEAGPSSEEMA